MTQNEQEYIFDKAITPQKIRDVLYGRGNKSIYGLFLINNLNGQAYSCYGRISYGIEGFLIKINKKSENNFMRLLIHECVHVLDGTIPFGKEEYWNLERKVEAEVNRTFDLFYNELQEIYSELKSSRMGLEITEMDSENSKIIDKTLLRNYELRCGKIR